MKKVLVLALLARWQLSFEILLDAGYEVYGLVRKSAAGTANIEHLIEQEFYKSGQLNL